MNINKYMDLIFQSRKMLVNDIQLNHCYSLRYVLNSNWDQLKI
jgi:hypothetical protein